MMLISRAQQIVLATSGYLNNLPSITGYLYCKMLRLKIYSDYLKQHHYSTLECQIELLTSSYDLSNLRALPISESGIPHSSDSPSHASRLSNSNHP